MTYSVKQTRGFNDLNGDGIPDYLRWDENNGWTVAMGTGTGFAVPKPIQSDSNQFELSRRSRRLFCRQREFRTACGPL